MSDVQAYIDRQLGIYCRFNYDNALRRLGVAAEESYYGLQNGSGDALEQDPPIFACRFAESPGYEHVLALANEDGRVAIQDTNKIQSNTILEGFQCHNNAVFDLAWMPKNMSFVTVSGDHTASLWDIRDGTPTGVSIFSSHTRSVKTAVFRPTDPSVFATGARDGSILVWDTRRAGTQPSSVVLKPDNCLMSCHSNFTPKTPGSHSKRARVEPVRATSITGMVFQDDTTLISCGECDGNVKVWDLRKNYNIYKREPLPKHSIPYCGSSTRNGYTNLTLDEARIRLYASCMDNVIYCFNVSTYSAMPEQRYVGHENSTFYIKTGLSPDCRYLVSGSSDKNAYIWNVKYSEPLVRLVGHWAEVTCAAWCRVGDTRIVTCSDDARHKIWRIGNEYLSKEDELELKGKAEVVPRTDVTGLPEWGPLERTPNSNKRKVTTPSSRYPKRTRLDVASKKTKRCLTDMMNATRDAEDSENRPKRQKFDLLPSVSECEEDKLLPAGIKRRIDACDTTPTKRRYASDSERGFDKFPDDWSYISPKAGTSFMTPSKCYERKVCRKISPKSPKALMPSTADNTSPSSPNRDYVPFGTPTKNLPNFVLNGEAPHLRLMSPAKKKRETTDWLTRIVREKKCKGEIPEKIVAPLSPKENVPTRRASTSEKTPKSTVKTKTLLKYFNVASKEKLQST